MFTSKHGIEFHLSHHIDMDLIHCDYYDDYFSHLDDCIEHEKGHDVTQFPHKCQYCSQRKKCKCDINKHMNKSCSKNTSHSITCKWCEKEVTGMSMLLEHLQEELETKGSYICRDCHLVYGKIMEVMKHQQSNECTKIRT